MRPAPTPAPVAPSVAVAPPVPALQPPLVQQPAAAAPAAPDPVAPAPNAAEEQVTLYISTLQAMFSKPKPPQLFQIP